MTGARRTLHCPICGHDLGVEPRVAGATWTPRQRWLLHKLRAAGFGPKIIAWVLGTTDRAIVCTIDRLGGRA